MTTAPAERKSTNSWWQSPYDRWLVAQDVPVFTGYYVEDLRTVELGWWDLRGCPGAVLNLVGHQGVTEAHVLQVPPGETIPPFRMATEEIVYVVEGQGIATVWAEGHPQINFEWQKHSLFRIPSNYYYQLSNARGDQPALTLHVSYLPLAMGIQPREEFFFNNSFVDPTELYGSEGNPFSSEAYAVSETVDRGGVKHQTHQWHANFFPDLNVWDKLTAYGSKNRRAFGAGITFPNSAIRTGMMVLPPQRYRAAHRHGQASPSSASRPAAASPSCIRRAARRSSARGRRRASSSRRTTGSTSTSTRAARRTGNCASSRPRRSWAMTAG